MGVGLQLLMVLMSVNFLAEASTGDAHYETEPFPHKQTNVTVAKMHELLRQYLLNRVPERLLELQESQGHLYTDKFPEPRESQRPLFTYKFPEPRPDETFAVPPSDPRYYYLPPSDRYENQETFERSSKLNRENKSSVRRPYTDVANTPVVNVVPEDRVVPENHPVHPPPEDEISNAEESDERVEVKQPASHHSAFRSSPAATPVSTVQIIKTPVGDFEATREDMIFMATVAGCSAAAVVIIAIVGFGWYRLHRRVKAAADVDYPAYGVTGPNKEISPTGDRKLAENAQMYHYQHQKQQIISMSNNRVSNDQRGSGSEAESDEENEEGDYTVYECPGLAATGEMEVKNPLFQDDPTPAGGPEPVTQPQSNAPPQK